MGPEQLTQGPGPVALRSEAVPLLLPLPPLPVRLSVLESPPRLPAFCPIGTWSVLALLMLLKRRQRESWVWFCLLFLCRWVLTYCRCWLETFRGKCPAPSLLLG